MTSVKLQSNDGLVVVAELSVIRCSGTIRNMLDSCGLDASDDAMPVPLPNVRGVVLEKVLEWAHQHRNDPQPAEQQPHFVPIQRPPNDEDDYVDEDDPDTYAAPPQYRDVPAWDRSFLEGVERGMLFDLVRAANYLDIRALLDVTCMALANLMTGKSTRELRALFCIPPAANAADDESDTSSPSTSDISSAPEESASSDEDDGEVEEQKDEAEEHPLLDG